MRDESPHHNISLQTFGNLACYRGATKLEVPPRSILLLVYLALRPKETHSRDGLADLLWNSADTAHARHSLSQALYVLRKILPEASISSTANSVSLDDPLDIDAQRLEKATRDLDVETIVSVHRGDFLATVSSSMTRRWHDWKDNRAFHYRKIAGEALATAVVRSYDSGQWHTCLAAANWLTKNSIADATIAQRAATASQLLRDAGIPLAALDSDAHDPPIKFVGRADELRQLRHEWSRVQAGDTRISVIRGEPGIGKTRLAERMARITALEGAATLAASCYEPERHVAFGPLISILSDLKDVEYLSSKFSSTQSQCLMSLMPGSTAIQGGAAWNPTSKYVLFDAITAAIRIHSGGRPILIWLDDFQWCDESTAEWLHHYYRSSVDEYPSLLMLCIRSGESHESDSIRWVERVNSTVTINVSNLSHDDAEVLVRNIAATRNVSGVQTIIDRCGGHPFYIVAMSTESEHESAAHAPGELPDPIQKLILSRFGRLSTSAQAIAETLALATSGLPMTSLLAATGLSLPDAVEGMRELDQAVMLRAQPTDLCHELIKQGIRTSMPDVVRALRHRQIFLALDESARASERARHASECGLHSDAYASARRAAQEAMDVYAYTEACFYRRMALENARAVDERRTALLELIELLNLLLQHAESRPLIAECMSLCEQCGDEDGQILCETTRIASDLAAHEASVVGLWTDLKRLVPLISTRGNEPRLRDAINLALSFHQHITDREELQRIFSFVERRSSELTDPARADILSRVAMAVAFLDGGRAVVIADEAVEIARVLPDPRPHIRSLNARGAVKMIVGDFDGAMCDLDSSEQIPCNDGARELRFPTYANRACILFGRGEMEKARGENAKALASSYRQEFTPLVNEACASAYAGDYDNARVWANRTLEENTRFGAPWVDIVAKSVLGTVMLGEGQIAQAHRLAHEIRNLLTRSALLIADWSYTELFLSNMDLLDGKRGDARARVESALDGNKYLPEFGRCRLEIQLAHILATVDTDLAYYHAKTAYSRAQKIKSTILTDRAAEILERIRLASP